MTTSKIVSTAPELQPKQTTPSGDMVSRGGGGGGESERQRECVRVLCGEGGGVGEAAVVRREGEWEGGWGGGGEAAVVRREGECGRGEWG